MHFEYTDTSFTDSETDDTSIWPLVRQLREAPDVKIASFHKSKPSQRDLTPPSLNTSVNTEQKPNVINQSIVFKKVNKRYSQENLLGNKLTRKQLEQENELLRQENQKLCAENYIIKQQHVQDIQKLQANHEIKTQKIKSDLKHVIEALKENMVQNLQTKLDSKIEQVCNEYEQLIAGLKIDHNKQLKYIKNQYRELFDQMMSSSTMNSPRHRKLSDNLPPFKKIDIYSKFRHKNQSGTESSTLCSTLQYASRIQEIDSIVEELSVQFGRKNPPNITIDQDSELDDLLRCMK